MRWKNLKREYQVIFYFLERAIDMNAEHKMAIAKASSNKGREAAILVSKSLGNMHLECSIHFWLFQDQAYTDKLE